MIFDNKSTFDNLRELSNYRHPDPRRVWKGGSKLRSLPPFPEDRVDPEDREDWEDCSFVCKFVIKINTL